MASRGDLDGAAGLASLAGERVAFQEHTERSLFMSLGAGARFGKNKRIAPADRQPAAGGAHGARRPAKGSAAASSSAAQAAATSLDFFGTGAFKSIAAPDAASPASDDDEVEEPVVKKARQHRPSKDHTDDEAETVDDEEEEEEEDAPLESAADLPLNTFEDQQVFRKRFRIRATGNDVPAPVASFSSFAERYNLATFLSRNLSDCGYAIPTPIQMQALPVIAEGRELLACAPTGSGKTLAYVLPIIHALKSPSTIGYRAVFVVPTRELAQQIFREIKRVTVGRNFKACVLTKATSAANSLNNKAAAKFDILITTPMRLVHLVKEDAVDLSHVLHLVLDEGDKLLEMGFLEQVDTILAACTHTSLNRHLLSATLSSAVESLAKSFMRDPVQVVIGGRSAAAQTVDQKLLYVGSEDGKLLALRQLVQRGVHPPVLVFVQSKERAKDLFHELVYDGINVDVIHAERTQQQRDNIVEQFRAGRIWFLIATDLMGRGMDFKGVNMVVNYDFPQTTVSYIHRIGRAGRAGRRGEAVTFFTNDDAPMLRSIAHVIKSAGGEVPEYMLQMRKRSRNERKERAKHPIERRDINPIPQFDKRQWGHKRQMIEQSHQKTNKKDDEK